VGASTLSKTYALLSMHPDDRTHLLQQKNLAKPNAEENAKFCTFWVEKYHHSGRR